MDTDVVLAIAAAVAIFAIPLVIAYYRRKNILLVVLLSVLFWPAAMIMVLKRSDPKPSKP